MELLNQILVSQFEAALCMLNQCIVACQEGHWEGKIANDTFRQVAYHTLFYADLYLSPNETAFVRRTFRSGGGDDRGAEISPGLDKDETGIYVAICRQKMTQTLNGETAAALAGASGFTWRKITRAELHVYNIRHIQHHTGQLSAYLRRVDSALSDPKALPWVAAGWK